METRHLEFFVAVAEELNFTRAAQRVHVGQSTVSAGVQALEREIGAALFARSTRRVSLTSIGRDLLPLARSALTALAEMRALGIREHQHVQGTLRIGASSHLQALGLPSILGGFQEAFPMVDISLHASPEGCSGLLEQVRRGAIDVAFCGLPPPAPLDLFSHVLRRQRLVALVPAQHALAGRTRISLTQLLEDDFVETAVGLGTRHVVDHWLSRKGLGRRISIEVPDENLVGDFVAAGFGVAVVPEDAAGRDTLLLRVQPAGAVAVVPLREAIVWDLSVIARYRGGSPALDALLGHLSLSRADH